MTKQEICKALNIGELHRFWKSKGITLSGMTGTFSIDGCYIEQVAKFIKDNKEKVTEVIKAQDSDFTESMLVQLPILATEFIMQMISEKNPHVVEYCYRK